MEETEDGVNIGTVEATVGGVVTSGSSTIAGFTNTLLSATTGRDGVATSVESKTGVGSKTPGSATALPRNIAIGRGAVARQSFLPLATPHTHTTAFFLSTVPGLVHETERFLDFIVGYQMFPVFVFAHTADTLDIWPGCVQTVPATNAAFRAREDSSLPHATTVANKAATTLVLHKNVS